MSRSSHRTSQAGFTLVEVMVAIVILLVGVLGVVSMVDGANAVTVKTKAREGANNVARSVVEVARAVPYKSLSDTSLFAALASRPGLADTTAGSDYTIESRNFDYEVSMQVCSMDDPKDHLAEHDGTIEFCPDSDVGSSSDANVDRNPDDYKRIAITLTWKRRSGGSETVKQTSLVSNPVGGLGPTVVRLAAVGVTGTPAVVTAEGAVDFEADTSTDAEQLLWSVDGAPQGKADPVGASKRSFAFTWDIEGTSGGRYFEDCTYVVQAEALDDKGRAGSPKALTVVLNRRLPKAPQQFEGGRNGNGDYVDLRWKPSVECDVLGYRVYRSATSGSGPWTQITCLGQSGTYVQAPECIDDPGGADPVWYYVAAVDTGPGGSPVRPGDPSTVLTVTNDNAEPSQPVNVVACLGGTPACNEPDGTPAADNTTVLSWDPSSDSDGSILLYRIYRDGTSYADRVGIFFPSGGGGIAWTDPETPSGTHTYYVSAVDDRFGESPLSSPGVSFP